MKNRQGISQRQSGGIKRKEISSEIVDPEMVQQRNQDKRYGHTDLQSAAPGLDGWFFHVTNLVGTVMMAFSGQTCSQTPQPTHLSVMAGYIPFSKSMAVAFNGQRS